MAATQAADAGCGVQQWHELSGIVTVSAGQRNGKRGAMPGDDQVVLASGQGPADWRRFRCEPPLSAQTCEPLIASSSPSLRNSASNTPRADGARHRLPSSPTNPPSRHAAAADLTAGTSRQLTLLHSTKTMPATQPGQPMPPRHTSRHSGVSVGGNVSGCGVEMPRTRTKRQSRSFGWRSESVRTRRAGS